MRFDKTITLGNLLTTIGMALAALTLAFGNPGDYIRVEARVTSLEKDSVARDRREVQFQQDVRQDLTDLKNDLRELRQEASHVRWSELPPSPFRDVPRNKR